MYAAQNTGIFNLIFKNLTANNLLGKKSCLCFIFLFLVLFLLQLLSAPASAGTFSIRGGMDLGRLQMDVDMWDDFFVATLRPGVYVGLDYLIPLAAVDNQKAGQEKTAGNLPQLQLGAGGEISPLRRSGNGSGEAFQLFNFFGLLQYNFSQLFTRIRLGFSWLHPPQIQRTDSFSLQAGPAASIGSGFHIEETELEFFYAFNSIYITDKYIDKTERLDVHRIGFSLGFSL